MGDLPAGIATLAKSFCVLRPHHADSRPPESGTVVFYTFTFPHPVSLVNERCTVSPEDDLTGLLSIS
jgi:hypothetical protein